MLLVLPVGRRVFLIFWDALDTNPTLHQTLVLSLSHLRLSVSAIFRELIAANALMSYSRLTAHEVQITSTVMATSALGLLAASAATRCLFVYTQVGAGQDVC